MRIVSDFREWAYEKAREFDQFKKNHGYLCCCFFKRNTVLVNLKNGKTWIATCHKSDFFDTNIGKGVVFARFLGEEIPVERKGVNLSSLHYGDQFSIKDSKCTYIFIAQEPVVNRYIFVNEQTMDICSTSCNICVYTA